MADRSSAVKAMRDMADSSHGCTSCSAIVLRRRKLRASVSSYAAASITELLFRVPADLLFSAAGPCEEYRGSSRLGSADSLLVIVSHFSAPLGLLQDLRK